MVAMSQRTSDRPASRRTAPAVRRSAASGRTGAGAGRRSPGSRAPRRAPRRSGATRGAAIGLALTAGFLGVVMAFSWAGGLTAPIPSQIRQWEYSSVDRLNRAQIDNARTIIAVGRGGGMTDDAITIALMTAMQESSLRNLDHGDRDSLGLFQQRPSQGWGTPDQVRDPVWAAKSFYGINDRGTNPGLVHIRGWESMTPTAAAQAVQRSAYPDAYAQWEGLAAELLSTQDDVAPIV